MDLTSLSLLPPWSNEDINDTYRTGLLWGINDTMLTGPAPCTLRCSVRQETSARELEAVVIFLSLLLGYTFDWGGDLRTHSPCTPSACTVPGTQ